MIATPYKTVLTSLALVAGLAMGGNSAAQQPVVPPATAPGLVPRAEMEILRSEQQRREFQLEQQFNRQIDRNANSYRAPRPDVPQMRGSCVPTGNRVGSGCR